MSTTIAARRPGRLQLTGYGALYMLLAILAVALFCLQVTFIPLTIVTVGVVALQLVVPAVAGLATLHRRLAERILGEPVPAPYKKVEGHGWLANLRSWARDPAHWRDIFWLFVTMTLGWVMSILAVSFFLYIFWCLVYPFLWWVTPGTFDLVYGIIHIDTLGESFILWVMAAVAFALWWFITPVLVRGKARIDRALLSNRTEVLEQRVQTLAESRADTVDFSAAELRRIERDLHDGAQARLVALGMSLGLADDVMANNPEEAKRLLEEARATTTTALGELRSVVRGIHPPVLADRGLTGAVQALSLDMALPVLLTIELPGRPPAPVESATYFAVAECLANIGKHASANRAWVTLSHSDGALHIEVGDDGAGGASAEAGSGLK
ncbi:MAG: sensor histidine kinase, partial [Nocardioidaceae bacterium]